MKYFVLLIFVLYFWLLTISCQTKIVRINQRPIENKAGSVTALNTDLSNDITELHLRKKEITITPIKESNDTGSLFVKDNPNNYLFISKTPLIVGNYITIQVSALKAAQKLNTDTNQQNEGLQSSEAATTGQNENANTSSTDKMLEDMVQSFPNLAPDKPDTKPIKQFNMRVSQINPNGIVNLVFERSSVNENGAKQIKIRAKLPYDKYLTKDFISTEDIFDINWLENDNGSIIERYSYQWEDEYTLRLSGFSEAKSKLAKQLEEQRKYLDSIKQKLRNQIISLNKERQTMSKEREKLLKDKKQAEDKIKELEAKLQQYSSTKEELKTVPTNSQQTEKGMQQQDNNTQTENSVTQENTNNNAQVEQTNEGT